jgi:hypothetical protein
VGVVAHTCNPSIPEAEAGNQELEPSLGCIVRPCLTPVMPAALEVEIGRTAVQEQHGPKSSRDPISTNKKVGSVVYTYYPSYPRKHK